MAPRVVLLLVVTAAVAGCSGPQAEPAVDQMGVVSAVVPAAEQEQPAASLQCTGTELTLFACHFKNGKSVALCASPDATATSGYVRYAYGAGESAELSFPDPINAPGDRFRSTRVVFPSGNGRHAYSFENGDYRYIAYQLWTARDGSAARGGLMVLNARGLPVADQSCLSLDESEQAALALPPYPMPEDDRLGGTSTLPFGDSMERQSSSSSKVDSEGVHMGAMSFSANGRSVLLEGASCEEESSLLSICTGDVRLTLVGAEALGSIRLREVVLTSEYPLHVGEGALAKAGATPSFAIVDYDRDGLEDLAVAADRLGSYGQLSYFIFLRRPDGWVLSPEFSALTEGRMGLPRRQGDFWVAFGKDGCCRHWEERYELIAGKPVLREAEITTSNPDGTTTTEVIRGEDAKLELRGEG